MFLSLLTFHLQVFYKEELDMAENCRECEDFEFDNRVNNLMWTIGSNYGVDMPRALQVPVINMWTGI